MTPVSPDTQRSAAPSAPLPTLVTPSNRIGSPTALLRYRPWRGRFRAPAWGLWPIARVSLRLLFRRRLFWLLYAAGLLIFLMFFFGQFLLDWAITAVSANRRTAITQAVATVAPAVVTVQTEILQRVAPDPFDWPFGGESQQRSAGLGTGFIIRADGVVVGYLQRSPDRGSQGRLQPARLGRRQPPHRKAELGSDVQLALEPLGLVAIPSGN